MKIKHPFKIILLVLLLLLFKTNVGNAEVRYNPNDLRVKSNASVNDIYNMLEGSFICIDLLVIIGECQ